MTSTTAGPDPGAGPEHLSFSISLPFVHDRRGYLPVLRVTLEWDLDKVVVADALVDTGAALSLFDGTVAAEAGADPTKGFESVVPVAGVAGATHVEAYVHRVVLHMGKRHLVCDMDDPCWLYRP